MASLAGAITALSLIATPAGYPAWNEADAAVKTASDTASLSVSESSSVSTGSGPQEYTDLALTATPGPRYGDFTKSFAAQFDLAVSDDALISALEDPVDEQYIETTDTAGLSVTESVLTFNDINVVESALVSTSETVAIEQSGTVDNVVSDTASLSVTESVALDVSIDVTDTTSLSVSDSGAVDVSTEALDRTDTASLSVSEIVIVDVYAGAAEFARTDTASISITDSASVDVVEGIGRIAMVLKAPRIRFKLR